MLRLIGAGLALLLVLAGAAGVWFYVWYGRPGPLAESTTILVPKRGGLAGAAEALAEAGAVGDARLFQWAARLTGSGSALKAGEYVVPQHISPADLIALLRTGKTVIHRLTVPEGFTTPEVLALVETADALEGPVTEHPAEGTLFPDTYFYQRGETRSALIDTMRRRMAETVARLWRQNPAGRTSLASPEDAVILASIIEKETAVPAERPKIAGVFLNRLRLGMRLQSDPTVIYAITQGRERLGRPLDKQDLATPSPYNTYVSDGLPPGPIDNPGRAALEAAMNPDSTDALYFVADGSGGHAFSATLDQHHKNVQAWHQANKPK
jgi:UPF0755 protein